VKVVLNDVSWLEVVIREIEGESARAEATLDSRAVGDDDVPELAPATVVPTSGE